MTVPRVVVPRVAPRRPEAAAWVPDEVPSLPPFVLADGSGIALQQTRVRVADDGGSLLVRFDCEDRDIWGTFTRRDDPLWQEEAVEVFVAPGGSDPARYFEFEVSPFGVLFDADVRNPASRREEMIVDAGWDCPGVLWCARVDPVRQRWRAEIAIPWAALAPGRPRPGLWRANFYRIERPRDGRAEWSCWSTTRTNPSDFHKPERFGVLEVAQ